MNDILETLFGGGSDTLSLVSDTGNWLTPGLFDQIVASGIDLSQFSDQEIGNLICSLNHGGPDNVSFTGQHHDPELDGMNESSLFTRPTHSDGTSFTGYTADYQGIKSCWYSSDGKVYDRGGNCVGTH